MFFLRWYLWIAPNVLLAGCLIGLFRRRLHRRFPLFAAYASFGLIQFVTMLTAALLLPFLPGSHSPLSTYRWLLVGSTGINATLELAVLYELANELLVYHSSLAGVLRPLWRWAVGLLLLLAAACSALLPDAGIGRIMRSFQVLNFSASLIKIGLLLTLFLFSRALHISWRSLPTGIALGFGVGASADISASALISALVSALGKSGFIRLDLIQMSAFHICVLIWIIYIFLPEKTRKSDGTGLQKSELEFWDRELQRMAPR